MESIWNFIVELFTTPITLYIINALLIITVIFNERKSSSAILALSLIHISEPTRQAEISYAVFCLKKKKKNKKTK